MDLSLFFCSDKKQFCPVEFSVVCHLLSTDCPQVSISPEFNQQDLGVTEVTRAIEVPAPGLAGPSFVTNQGQLEWGGREQEVM